jgi:galactokinase
MLEAVKGSLSPVVYKRAHHGITEDARTLDAVKALERGDFVTVGKRMNESHDSLRDDYEVSCDELDFLVAEARRVPGVLGSRMTGGGFGGCTVTLVERGAVENLIRHLKAEYKEKLGKDCDCYESVPSPGAGVIDLATGQPKKAGASKASSGRFKWITPAVGAVVVAAGLALALRLLRK